MDESWGPILQLFKIDPASAHAFIALTALFIIVLSILMYFQWKKRRAVMEEEWDWFYRMSEAKDLSVKEMKLLRGMIKRAGVKNPGHIFRSVKVFDQCVDREFAGRTPDGAEEEELAEEIAEIRRKLHFQAFPPGEILNSTRGIKRGQRLKITLNLGEKRHVLNAKVLSVDEEEIEIAVQDRGIYMESVSAGTDLKVYFWREGDAGYTFATKVTGKVDDFPNIVEISHSPDLERIDKRHYYRIYVSLPLAYQKLDTDQKKELIRKKEIPIVKRTALLPGRVVSLSGGGVSFLSKIPVQRSDILFLELDLHEPVKGFRPQLLSEIFGRVIRCKTISNEKYKIYAEFIVIPEPSREAIIEFVSLKQTEKV